MTFGGKHSKKLTFRRRNAFESVGRIRNEIEHYYTEAKLPVVQEAFAKSFAVTSKFATTRLKVDLRDDLSERAWEQFIEIREFYDT